MAPICSSSSALRSADGPDLGPELTVLATLTGALDLASHEARMFALRSIASADPRKRDGYTRLIKAIVPEAVRNSLEELLTTKFPDPFIDGFIDQGRAQGRAQGEAHMLLRVLDARGISVPADIRDRISSCADTAQLEAWFDRAIVAKTVSDIFGDLPGDAADDRGREG
jgi:hypothetical protein